MDHPWRRLRALPEWTLLWDELPGTVLGYTDFSWRTITLDSRLLQAERRCTIAHELEHVRRGPMPEDPIQAAREEEAIERDVARRMIPIWELGDALAWSCNEHEVAEELWVDVPTLLARVRGLHPAELAYLRRRTEHHEHN